MKNINYIPDKDINLEEGDLLGTKPYANTLLEIIENAKPPFTIGLFGGWGTGKSSIIKTIEEKYNKDRSAKTRVFVYDAWKYSKDSFRRTFILKLKETFRLDEGAEYQNFYNDKHEEIEGRAAISKNWWVYLIIFIISLILINLVPKLEGKEFEWSTFTISTFISAIIVFITKSYTEYKISITKPKTFAPEQFEEAFKDAVNVITKKKSIFQWFKFWDKTIYADKIVIVIDNIDRCHKELAFELLLTVKTFLEQRSQEVIFMLPIDEKEIKKHIERDGRDGNEFLRKLFNTTLYIKKFSEEDLFEFTRGLKGDHKLDISDDVASLISREFSKSPRKIIQFLNILQTEIKLAEEQENDSNFKKGTITENIEFLVKILLIREEWSSLYEELKENPFLLEDINKQIDNGKKKVVHNKDSEEKDVYLTSEQRRFFESTRDITTTNVEAFFANKDAFPGIPDDIPKLVLSQDWKTVKTKYIEKEILSFNKLLEFIDSLFHKEVVNKKLFKRSGFNIFSFIFKVSEDKEFGAQLRKTFYSKGKILSQIKSKLNSKDIGAIILSFNPSLLLNFVSKDLDKNNKLFQEIVNVINNKENNDDRYYNLLSEFVDKFQGNETQLKEIRSRFSAMLKEAPDNFDRFKDNLKNTTVIESLIEPGLLLEFIDNLESNPNNGNNDVKVKIINQYNSSKGLSAKLLKQYTDKVVSFLNSANDLNTVNFWFANLYLLKTCFAKNDVAESVFAMLNNKYQTLYNWFTSYPDDEKYKSIVKYFLDISADLYISDKLSQDSDNNIKTWLSNFFQRTEYKFGWQYANNNYLKIVQKLGVMDWDFAQNIINKFNQLSEWEDKKEIATTLNLMLSKTTDDKGLTESQIHSILTSYINLIDEENRGEIVNWLLKILNNEVIDKQFKEVIEDRKFELSELLELLIELNKSELIEDVIFNILKDIECDKIETVFEKIEKAKVSKYILIKTTKTVLRNIERENENFECLMTFLKSKFSDGVIHNLIAEKMKHLLATGENEEILFALKIVDGLNISDARKLNAIKTLILDINESSFQDDDLKFVKKMKKKYK